jgi:glyoxylase-like metal-dependent hydrolase (beta-lactamase superfamily II)
MEVAPGIHRIEAPLADRIVCVYLLRGSRRTVLVDTGIASTPADAIVPGLAEAGVEPDQIDLVVVSHADIDHSGGNRAVQDLAPRALFLAHERDCALIEDVEVMLSDRYGELAATDGVDEPEAVKDWVRANSGDVPIDIRHTGEATLALGPGDEVALLHTPGHSLGHLTLWRESDRVAVAADAVLGEVLPTVDGGPALPPTYRYLADYERTIDRLAALEPALLLTSHFPVLRGADVQDFLARSRAFVQRVHEELRECLAASGTATFRHLIDELSPRLGSWPEAANDALRFPLAGHLERLIEAGDVDVAPSGDVRSFVWTGR